MSRKSKGKRRTIIFTDLDGTLIDFETYSPDIAAPLARKLVKDGVPLIFCSSKTLEEQLFLMKEMNVSTPCIVENGCGIYIPSGYGLLEDLPSKIIPGFGRLVTLGISTNRIHKEIANLSTEMGLDFRPYSRMTVWNISKVTGLSESAAYRAQNRDFSETLTASHSDEIWAKVNTALNEVGLQCLCGGRFYTVTSNDCSKGKAIKVLIDAYQRSSGLDWKSLAIGDSLNDFDMLQTSDQGYLVQRPDGAWNEMEIPGLIRIPAIGPSGWVQAVKEALPPFLYRSFETRS